MAVQTTHTQSTGNKYGAFYSVVFLRSMYHLCVDETCVRSLTDYQMICSSSPPSSGRSASARKAKYRHCENIPKNAPCRET